MSVHLVVASGNPAVARYFGRTHHGAILGTLSTIMVAGTGAGPLMAGAAYDLSGQSFTPILIVFALASVPLAISALFHAPPTPPAHPDVTPDPDEPDPPGVAL